MPLSVTSWAPTPSVEASHQDAASATRTQPYMPLSPAVASVDARATRAQGPADLQLGSDLWPRRWVQPSRGRAQARPRCGAGCGAAFRLWFPGGPCFARARDPWRARRLFGGAQGVRGSALGGGQLPGIDLLPGALIVAGEVAAAGVAIDLSLLGSGRRDSLLTQGTGRHQQAPARARDHL